jgi:hypothetical protein
MKRSLVTLILLLLTFILFSQSDENKGWSKKYYEKNLSSTLVIKIMDECGFVPAKQTKDVRDFKSTILQLSDKAFDQINIDTWYLCSNKHEENFQIFNMYYKKVTKEYYDTNCKALIALMLLDGTVRQPK